MSSNKKLAAAMAAILAVSMCLAAFLPANALFGKSEAAPAVSAFAKSELPGSIITFSAGDFTSRVSGSQTLDAIVISSLPEGGALTLAGRTLSRGESVNASSLSGLSFVPEDESAEVFTSFTFLPVFSKSGAGSEAVTVSINLSTKPNSAPVAQDLKYETYAGITLCAPLKYTDADGDKCTFTITSQPKKGTVEANDSGFCYTPESGKTGSDSFTYTATDSKGETSGTATVEIKISKRASKDTFQYSDMKFSPAHNAALKLRESGVLVGETIGQDSFLYPEKPVSRAEFVALVSAIADLSLPTMAVGTGLSDNAEIPVWAQPYIAAAVHSGIILGEKTETGNRVFRANDSITRAEAASIINRALDLASDGRGLQFADSAAVPQWAAQSIVNTAFAEIIPVFSDNTIRAQQTVTREDAAQMLCQMLAYRELSEKPSGLFGWLK